MKTSGWGGGMGCEEQGLPSSSFRDWKPTPLAAPLPYSRLRWLETNDCSELPASLGERSSRLKRLASPDSLSLPEIAFAFFSTRQPALLFVCFFKFTYFLPL